MGKNLYDVMSEDYGLVEEFYRLLVEMPKTRYILAEKKINNIMKISVYSKILYVFFGKVLHGFDYEREVKNCRVDHNRLVMPSDKKRLVALVFCLLNDIDSKNIYLNDFLRQFFRGEKDINIAYKVFCGDVIAPFCSACEELLAVGVDNYAVLENKNDFAAAVAFIVADINADPALTINQKDDLIFSLDKLGNLIRIGEKKAALAVYESLYEDLMAIRLSSETNGAIKSIERIVFAMSGD